MLIMRLKGLRIIIIIKDIHLHTETALFINVYPA